MRIQLIFLLALFSLGAFASEESDIQDLFNRYERVVSHHETNLLEGVFSSKFIKENGGKKEFIEKIKSEPKSKNKSIEKTSVTWRKGQQSENILVSLKEAASKKTASGKSHNEFVVIKEEGKLKIDGKVGDAN